MSEEMKKKLGDEELNKEQLDIASGGINKPNSKKTIICPHCGQETEISLFIPVGADRRCQKCNEIITL